jgi:hypothetical protein
LELEFGGISDIDSLWEIPQFVWRIRRSAAAAG